MPVLATSCSRMAGRDRETTRRIWSLREMDAPERMAALICCMVINGDSFLQVMGQISNPALS